MNRNVFFVLLSFGLYVFIGGCSCQEKKSNAKFKNNVDSVSYVIGNNIGESIKKDSVDINLQFMIKGLEDGLSKNPVVLFNDSIKRIVMMKFQQEMMAKQEAKNKAAGAKQIEEGKKFLEENKKNKDVVTLPSGLQYKVIKTGKGPKPSAMDKVEVHYEGRLINGTIFDSSYERKEPASFQVTGVIKGWTEALQLMNVGSEWELYIPENLAYGDKQMGKILPYSTLIFKVELLSIKKEDTKK
ncbi:MAG: FKBP-type peptidyl-prolyl cis-trans isomerase [Bacteroidales bacterium]|nr:FKBP-type peptidyl-prolyl cis-trans isomerase [Bacteroidales bacterium]